MAPASWSDRDLLVDLDCPECGATIPATVGDVRTSGTLDCHCGQRIRIDGSELAAELTRLESSVDRFER
ncbi:MAG: hypothetical protein JW895_15585 [Thermoleophilaceae bacterium]|nr:hypothetical protein [Thermoleophilaceae bacterium]